LCLGGNSILQRLFERYELRHRHRRRRITGVAVLAGDDRVRKIVESDVWQLRE